ncbi:hypothetical protein HG536_0C02960 [Torulaspora globosa]|uniref:Large ribosomal subunit protein bL32m n=1 Tax=Torulaspora globosa TaxID=48254 RepID=A0A7G3ZF41_9SACH|nr:uncharacterized protein HG536_0C02960 [Torulaspora globosa]QLL32127.1 hypothetical protein HG536_0C02960 [Torulaspora globosa]
MYGTAALPSLGRILSQSAVLLPWTATFGRAVDSLPVAYPIGLLEKLFGQRDRRKDERDFFSNNGILLAVPKKKVSHQKKRQKLYGPGSKQLKMINHLNKCPSCGHQKRANTLCMYCFDEIRKIWKTQTFTANEEVPQEKEISEVDKRVLYPGKKLREHEKKLRDKESYVERRMRTLPVQDNKQ